MITSESCRKPCGCRSVGECSHNTFAELDALDAMVDAFAVAMKAKLRKKWREGQRGWDDRECERGIRNALAWHVERGQGQEVDIANLAAMLWNMGSNANMRGERSESLSMDELGGCARRT